MTELPYSTMVPNSVALRIIAIIVIFNWTANGFVPGGNGTTRVLQKGFWWNVVLESFAKAIQDITVLVKIGKIRMDNFSYISTLCEWSTQTSFNARSDLLGAGSCSMDVTLIMGSEFCVRLSWVGWRSPSERDWTALCLSLRNTWRVALRLHAVRLQVCATELLRNSQHFPSLSFYTRWIGTGNCDTWEGGGGYQVRNHYNP